MVAHVRSNWNQICSEILKWSDIYSDKTGNVSYTRAV